MSDDLEATHHRFEAGFLEWLDGSQLDQRAKAAVRMRADGLTLRAAGAVLGVSGTRISQICRKAERTYKREKPKEGGAGSAESHPGRPVEELGLSVRAEIWLRSEGIKTAGGLARFMAKGEAHMLTIPNLSRKVMNELKAVADQAPEGEKEAT